MRSHRLPPWIRTKPPTAKALETIRSHVYAQGLSTVCAEARCPNQGECFQRGTATFLILGDTCTRKCGFCAVTSAQPGPVNQDEPQQVADSVAALGLRHVVVTSVTRDDLPDGGASVFVETIRAIRTARPGTGVEVLIPDFRGSERALMQVIEARPDVIGHNLETVSRLYPLFRQGASYQRSLEILRVIRDTAAETITKSGLMVGVGETREELIKAMGHLAGAGCTVVTLGQYLQPTRRHHPVAKFVPPAEFAELARLGEAAGIPMVVAGPLVRSSYQAGRIFEQLSGSMAANQVGGQREGRR